MAQKSTTDGPKSGTGSGNRPPGQANREKFRRLPVEMNVALLGYLKHVSDLVQISQVEAVRRAILFYGWAVEQSLMGRQIVSVDDGDEVQEGYRGEPSFRMAALEREHGGG